MSYFQRTRPECKIGIICTTGRQNEIDCFSVDGFCSHCNTVIEAMGCFCHFFPVKKCVYLSLKRSSNVVVRRESSMNWDETTKEKKASIIEMWECAWWRLYRRSSNVELQIRESIQYRLLTPRRNKAWKITWLCAMRFWSNSSIKTKFANFPSVFKNNLVSKNYIGKLMKDYAEQERLLSQARKM